MASAASPPDMEGESALARIVVLAVAASLPVELLPLPALVFLAAAVFATGSPVFGSMAGVAVVALPDPCEPVPVAVEPLPLVPVLPVPPVPPGLRLNVPWSAPQGPCPLWSQEGGCGAIRAKWLTVGCPAMKVGFPQVLTSRAVRSTAGSAVLSFPI